MKINKNFIGFSKAPDEVRILINYADHIIKENEQTIKGYKNNKIIFTANGYCEGNWFIVTSIGGMIKVMWNV